ncbi:Non-specific serine/threonine protein kinase protein [Dioscorea alata]|uniref:Non-specific serine/threonine protein kinase protein n=2 Tax=Dioscorea alata TaxID=55571 RepID=A0ACB7WND5_DIOAL|nr:Non-specific serine/threonine protein kinase protein [Dioscorea alata]
MLPSSQGGGESVVLVAVRAEGELSKTALAWALTHIVRPGDLVTLLAVLPDLHDSAGKGVWRRMLRGFPKFNAATDARRRERRCQISASCSQMALQIDGHSEINVRIKVVGSEEEISPGGGGVVAAEANRIGADWVVLDKQLKQEEKHCMEQLQCNIVAMKGSHARVLRLNLGETQRPCLNISSSSSALKLEPSEIYPYSKIIKNSLSNSSTGSSSMYVCGNNPLFSEVQTKKLIISRETSSLNDLYASDSDGSRRASPRYANPALEFNNRDAGHDGVYWIPEYISEDAPIVQRCSSSERSNKPPTTVGNLKGEFSEYDMKSLLQKLKLHRYLAKERMHVSDVREAVSLHGSTPSIPPPLCSLCRHKAPLFGKPPRQFTYQELEEATHGFSDENLLADGWSGRVHRGMLQDGRAVAVKQLKTTGRNNLRGVEEFLAEVEMLSRAQHRNVVMLVGFCIEENVRVLVYEYICNGSLDFHLYGQEKAPLDWHARVKIAMGVARGLRYLHEDCRVGFVVHRDIRPNNILLTHDLDPLFGDLSITRRQTEYSPCVGTNVPQTFGHLAPEYIEYGIETEKADVYAFGVVLLELITGCRAMDTSRPKGQQFLAEWARPLLSQAAMDGQSCTVMVNRYLDPRLDQGQVGLVSQPFRAMTCAASLCLRREPETRPSMSKVLRVLEGNALVDAHVSVDSIGSRSGRISGDHFPGDGTRIQMGGSMSLRFPNEVVSGSLCADQAWPLFS